MSPGDLIEFGPVGSNGSFKSPWMQQRLAAAKTRRAIYIAQHERIVAGLEADAARYRWLRESAAAGVEIATEDGIRSPDGPDLDAAIDAFLAQTTEGGVMDNDLIDAAWRLYCTETAGDADVRDNWAELPERVRQEYLIRIKAELNVPRCPKCGYTHMDCLTHMDHHLCGEPRPPERTPPATSEADHYYVCATCGEAVDMRQLPQVIHHERDGHGRMGRES